MQLLNIHTHHCPTIPAQAIVNLCFPQAKFAPQTDALYSIGIHPWDVTSDTVPNWDYFGMLAAHPQVVAIGECGIDRLVNSKFLKTQERIFIHQQEIAEALGKPLIIHDVRGAELLRSIKLMHPSPVSWIIHGFRGNAEKAMRYTDQGFFLSFGEKYNEASLRITPPKQIFIETDTSMIDIQRLYQRAAAVRGTSCEEFTAQVQQNMQRVFFSNH